MAAGLTVLIPCKNERLHLAGAIEAARQVADEVLVADSGSDDGSIEIALSLGARVIQREYRSAGDFKNWAIPQAKYPWVFTVDSDEQISPELATEVRQRVLTSHSLDGFWVPRVNYFHGKPLRFGAWGPSHLLRIVRRDVGRYVGSTDHAEVSLPAERVGKLKHALLHDAVWSYDRYLTKLNRYASMQAELWHKAGRKPSFWQIALRGPSRFFNDYVLRGAFLDGAEGLQGSFLIAYASYLKQVRLWELHRVSQVAPERPAAKIAA
jgi:glycosyltransferase involved in cell wall biosynthesis